MSKTATPISERTDESLVRAIAEWMGLDFTPKSTWSDLVGLSYMHLGRKGLGKVRQFDPLGAPATRERVMLAMPTGCRHQPFNHGADFYGWDIVSTNSTIVSTNAPTLGRAFCEAVVSWIEAQEPAR